VTKRMGTYVRISKPKPEDVKAAGGEQAAKRKWEQRQLKGCLAKIETEGWEAAEQYRDEDSAYSVNTKRPDYERALDDIASGRIDGLVFWKLDRLIRRTVEFWRFYQVCDSAGAVFASATETFDTTTPLGRGIVGLIASMAEQESENVSLRVKSFNQQRADEGLPSTNTNRPFGWADDFVTLVPEEATMIRDAYQRVLVGDGLYAIAQDWNKVCQTPRGHQWRATAIRHILLAPRVAGFRQHQKKLLLDPEGNPVAGQWQPILTPEEWEAVKAKLLDPQRRTFFRQGSRTYLLSGPSGVGRCAKCGEPLKARARHDRTRAYGCTSNACGARRLADELEDYVRDATIAVLTDSEAFGRLLHGSEASETIASLSEELRLIESRIARLDHDFYVEGRLPEERYRSAATALERRKEELTKQLAGNGRQHILAEVPHTEDALRRVWEQASVDWRRSLVAAVFKEVRLHPKKHLRSRSEQSAVELVPR
jgi:site-specific DNA recombinase